MARYLRTNESAESFSRRLAEAKRLIASEECEQAEVLLAALFAEGDRSLELFVELTRCHLILGQLDKARRYLTLAESRNGGDSRVACCRGVLALMEGRYAHALGHFSRSLMAEPSNTEAYKWRGVCYRELRDPGRALADLNRAMMHARGDATLSINRGTVYADLGELERALTDFERACELAPHHPLPHCNAGHMLFDLERLDEAQDHYDQAVELDFVTTDAWAGLSEVFEARNDRAEALRCVATVLALEPDNGRARLRAAELLVTWGRGAQAMPLLDALVGDEPGHCRALTQRAAAFLQTGSPQRCIEDCDRVERLAPGNGTALLLRGLARLQEERGETHEAEADLRRARDLAPDHPLPALLLAEIAYVRGEHRAAQALLLAARELDTRRASRRQASSNPESLAVEALADHPTVASALRRARAFDLRRPVGSAPQLPKSF